MNDGVPKGVSRMSDILRGSEIAPAGGKLGVLMPGIGAVSSTLSPECLRPQGLGPPDRLARPIRQDPVGQEDREPVRPHPGLHRPGRARRHGLRRLGLLPRHGLRGGPKGQGPNARPHRGGPRRARSGGAHAGRLRPGLRPQSRRPPRQEGPDQDGPGRSPDEGHRRFPGPAQGRPDDHALDGLDRGLSRL